MMTLFSFWPKKENKLFFPTLTNAFNHNLKVKFHNLPCSCQGVLIATRLEVLFPLQNSSIPSIMQHVDGKLSTPS